MPNNLIHDRGRGPELVGTRITVADLLPYFLDATATEAYLCRLYELTPEQVAAARAYVLNHPDTVLAVHLQIEERLAAGNPPEMIARAKQTHDQFVRFKDWLNQRQQTEALQNPNAPTPETSPSTANGFPTFREWMAQRESPEVKGS